MMAGQPTKDYHRYCPGEEHIRISDAICRGRRFAHFPKCRGCQFNDDEASQKPRAEDEGGELDGKIEAVFREDDVFAASPEPLSEDAAWRIGHAIAQYLRGKLRGYDRADPAARTIVVGRDTRSRSRCLQKALAQGARSSGMDVVDIGVVDTPQLYFAVSRLGACGGIQTTGGFMPAECNGFTFCAANGVPIGFDTGLASIHDIASRVPRHETGTMAAITSLNLAKPYAEFLRGVLIGGNKLARPLKVAVDASNGAAGKWVPIVFKRVKGLTIVPLNFEHDGAFAHTPDPSVARNTRELRQLVKRRKADFGVCFDGDASRCAFFDEKGIAIPADCIAALLARMFIECEPGAAVVFDLRAIDSLPEEIERAGGAPIRSRVGQILLKKAMVEQNAAFGCDLSDRFYFRNASSCESALLTFVHVINLVNTSGRKLSELVRPMQRYRSSGEIVLASDDPDRAVRAFAAAHPDAAIDDLDGLTVRYPEWWVNLRPDARESCVRLTLQAKTKKLVDLKLAELRPLFEGEDE